MKEFFCLLTGIISCAVIVQNLKAADEPIKIGLIGLDTSHAPAFVKALNFTSDENYVPGGKIVCAYPGGSPDVEASFSRVDKFTAQIRDELKVEIVNDIETLLTKVDAVILTSVDGRVHLEQVKPVIKAKKPVFIDKPMGGSLADVKEIFKLANEAGVPCFSSSSLRYFKELQDVLNDKSLGKILGCDAFSPCKFEPHHPDLFWYGVHGVETLFTVMGAGCKTVSRTTTKDTDVVTGIWEDGRIGTFRGTRDGGHGYGATIFFEKGTKYVTPGNGSLYTPLLQQIITFFKTKKAPVSQQETINIFEFMDAADKSKAENGCPVKIN